MGDGKGDAAGFLTVTGRGFFLTGLGLTATFLTEGAWVTIFFFLIGTISTGLGGVGGISSTIGTCKEARMVLVGMLSMSSTVKSPD